MVFITISTIGNQIINSKYMISKYGILIRIFTTKLYNRYAVEKYCNNNIKGIQPINPTDNITTENPINNSLSNVVLIDIFDFNL